MHSAYKQDIILFLQEKFSSPIGLITEMLITESTFRLEFTSMLQWKKCLIFHRNQFNFFPFLDVSIGSQQSLRACYFFVWKEILLDGMYMFIIYNVFVTSISVGKNVIRLTYMCVLVYAHVAYMYIIILQKSMTIKADMTQKWDF